MKKSDLKQLIKPLVKECIHEVLIEEGLLSNVVSEVVKGLQSNLIVETATTTQKQDQKLFNEEVQMKRKNQETNSKLKEHRKRMMESVGRGAYNGVNIFENVDPMQPSETQAGSADLGNPRDAGVDISSLVGDASKIWQAIK
jgi:DhnA family fructose-bisphosphate aldolase class Ia